jgi:thioesterase domain-containing protein
VTTFPDASTEKARATIWASILGTAKHLRKRQQPPTGRPTSVVQLKEGAAEAPVYFIGARLAEFRISQLMRSGRSIYGIEVPWRSVWRDAVAKNDTSALPTMEEMVAPYVEALSVHTRSAPCVLIGHSFGGLMAFEAAHQILERGGKVEMVILLDAQAAYPSAHQAAYQTLRKVWKRSPSECATDRMSNSISSRFRSSRSIVQWMLLRQMNALRQHIVRSLRRDPGVLTANLDDRGTPVHWETIDRLYDNAENCYRLRPLDCRGVLLRADPEDDRPIRLFDCSLGWDNLFNKGLDIVQVTGDHFTMMWQEPHIHTLAREMSVVLDRS